MQNNEFSQFSQQKQKDISNQDAALRNFSSQSIKSEQVGEYSAITIRQRGHEGSVHSDCFTLLHALAE